VTSLALEEVVSKKSMYFDFDEDKKDKNIKIYNFDAPGNSNRTPNVIIPHGRVNIQNYVDAKSLTPEKMT